MQHSGVYIYDRCMQEIQWLPVQVVSIVDADEFYQLVTKDGLLEICLCKDGVVIERKNVSHPGKSCTLGVLQELVPILDVVRMVLNKSDAAGVGRGQKRA